MEIRDPVHGSIGVLAEEEPIIAHRFFQRLRNVKQLGLAEHAFPGATHHRFLHSIGVMHVGERAFERLFGHRRRTADLLRMKETFRLACLLHDTGHAPLSHTTESVMPPLRELRIPGEFLDPEDGGGRRRAVHEDYTVKSIADSSFIEAFRETESRFGVERRRVADLLRGSTDDPGYFALDGTDHFPVLHQLISGDLDCDRMDYLLRDSYFCGVSYGSFDLDWLIGNMRVCPIGGRAFLGVDERALLTFDDFLIGRHHMFIMVYFHHRAMCLEEMLLRFFRDSPDEYRIPADIEAFQECDDHSLMKALRKSANPHAKAIVANRTPPKVFESFNEGQLRDLERIQGALEEGGGDFIRCSSTGRPAPDGTPRRAGGRFPVKVARRAGTGGGAAYEDAHTAADPFHRFRRSHAIDRLHCDLGALPAGLRAKVEGMLR